MIPVSKRIRNAIIKKKNLKNKSELKDINKDFKSLFQQFIKLLGSFRVIKMLKPLPG